MRIDAAVSAEVLRAISPLAIDAALQLIADHSGPVLNDCGKVNGHCNKRATKRHMRAGNMMQLIPTTGW